MKNLPKELVKISYTNGKLDDKSVKAIGEKLNRKLLKEYIKGLKQEEKKSMVFVTTPKPLTTANREKIKKLFSNKRIVEEIDPTMINGIKIVENDEEYEMDLNRVFHDIIRFIGND